MKLLLVVGSLICIYFIMSNIWVSYFKEQMNDIHCNTYSNGYVRCDASSYRYEGMMLDLKRHGRGKEIFINPYYQYEGEFKNDLYHGDGTLEIHADFAEEKGFVQGRWIKGQLDPKTPVSFRFESRMKGNRVINMDFQGSQSQWLDGFGTLTMGKEFKLDATWIDGNLAFESSMDHAPPKLTLTVEDQEGVTIEFEIRHFQDVMTLLRYNATAEIYQLTPEKKLHYQWDGSYLHVQNNETAGIELYIELSHDRLARALRHIRHFQLFWKEAALTKKVNQFDMEKALQNKVKRTSFEDDTSEQSTKDEIAL